MTSRGCDAVLPVACAAVLRVVLLAALLFAGPSERAIAQTETLSDAYAWEQYAADGHPHVRVVPSDRASCPAVTADERGVATTMSVVASAGFDRVLCDAALPLDARSARVGGLSLPPLPQRISRFVVLGDTGCRIKGALIQDCSDGRAWPFARIAQSIAREAPRPDLIVHVGDYAYRESPCPAGDRRCAGSPFGDNWTAWAVDFFEPGAPLFATAPIVWVRGNNEACARAGLGWSRYLAPQPSLTCREHESPAVASFADLRIVNVDSASGDETNPEPAAFERDERFADDAAAGRETFVVTHRPPLAYLAAHAAADPNGPHLGAILAGHIHLFGALAFAGAPPTIIVGNGGDTLTTAAVSEIATGVHATVEARFGYAVFDRTAGGWSISERDPDGSEHRRCQLRNRSVYC